MFRLRLRIRKYVLLSALWNSTDGYQPHEKSSDICSMEAVYLEMVTILNGRSLAQSETFYSENRTGVQHFHLTPEATTTWIADIRLETNAFDIRSLSWFAEVMQEQPTARPSVSHIIARITDA
jgi:hypothetical protein